jgi:TniQ
MIKGTKLLRTAIPNVDESLLGYIIRLTEINDYDTPAWILQMAGIQEYVQHKVSFSFKHNLNLLPLATLTGVEESKLASLIYQPVDSSRRKFSNHIVFGSPVPKYIIRPRLFKVCPSCLRESAHVRKAWELTPVTACPIHKCLLLGECPNCARRLPFNRSAVSCCTCKFDWRNARPVMIGSPELAVSKQIHVLCNLPSGTSVTLKGATHNPLYALSLLDFLSALFFIASQYGTITYMSGKRHIDTKGRSFNFPMKNTDIHSLLYKAFLTYEDWPGNYFAFFDWRRERIGGGKHCKGLRKDFAEYKRALYRQLDSPSLNFIREAFEEYLSTRWQGRHISVIKRINHAARQKKKYITFKEALKLLKVGGSGLKSLIAEGRLNAIVRPMGKTNMTLIELSHVNELRAKLVQLLPRVQAKSILGIDGELMPELIKHNLLRLHHYPTDLSNPHRYSLQDINDLLINIKNKVLKRASLRGHKRISFTITLRKLRNYGIGLGDLVKLILDGNISPCDMEASRGLGGLIFYKRDIENYSMQLIKDQVEDAVKVGEAARLLGLQKTPVYLLINKGLLTARKIAIGRRPALFVTKGSIDNFLSIYVLPAKIAPRLRTVSGYLTELLITKGIQPISGPKIDGGKCYVFRKSDLEKINLENLISIERQHQRSRYISPLVDLDQASKLLEINRETMQEYLENGVLKPHEHQAHHKCMMNKIHFSRRAIESFKARTANYRGLVSSDVAAKMLNKCRRNLYARYLHTGRLKLVLDSGKRGGQFFRRKDVEAMVRLEKETIRSQDVMVILNVSMSSIFRMTVSKELNPISGPHVDGYPVNLFLRSDIEELNAARAAFRAECLRLGKTTRFSKQPGRRSCPVQEKVLSRIRQLLEERSPQPEVKQRLAGLALHRQLVEEGYKVGATTVYKVLHKQLEQCPTV